MIENGTPYKKYLQYVSPGESIAINPKLSKWLGSLPPVYYTPQNDQDQTLVFESRFQSGNLQLALKRSDSMYDLILQNDINTIGHTQWYYFRVSNTKKNKQVKFNVLNLAKPDSLYNDGMKVLIFSEKEHEIDQNQKWFRGGYDISYYQNTYHRQTGQVGASKTSSSKFYYTFSFTYSFPHQNDTVFFAYCHPFTHTDLQRDLNRYENNCQGISFQRQEFCRTIAGYKMEIVTITGAETQQNINSSLISKQRRETIASAGNSNMGSQDQKTISSQSQFSMSQVGNSQTPSASNPITTIFHSQKAAAVAAARERQKKGVLITARVHPGQTNGSWMMRGVLQFLMSDLQEAKALREKFVFKIIPMLNIDGVVHGNYRCSMAGCDLNRRYKAPSKLLHPEVFNTKKLAKMFSKEKPIVLYCDLHGHSRRKNIFMYGNNNPNSPEQCRIFPFIMSKLLTYFSYQSSRFAVQKSKESTARITMWRDLKIPTIYTMEASFCGADKGPLAGQHFQTEHLEECGRKLCEALILFCNIDVNKTLERKGGGGAKGKKGMGSAKALMIQQQGDKDDQDDQKSGQVSQSYSLLKGKDIMKELMNNKALLHAGGSSGGGDVKSDGSSSAGSDDDPSGDNMNDEEIIKILPSKIKKKIQAEKKAQQKIKLKKKREDQKLAKQRQELVKKQAEKLQRQKQIKRQQSQLQRKMAHDRNKKKKPTMVDAWTQTTDKEDNGKKEGGAPNEADRKRDDPKPKMKEQNSNQSSQSQQKSTSRQHTVPNQLQQSSKKYNAKQHTRQISQGNIKSKNDNHQKPSQILGSLIKNTNASSTSSSRQILNLRQHQRQSSITPRGQAMNHQVSGKRQSQLFPLSQKNFSNCSNNLQYLQKNKAGSLISNSPGNCITPDIISHPKFLPQESTGLRSPIHGTGGQSTDRNQTSQQQQQYFDISTRKNQPSHLFGSDINSATRKVTYHQKGGPAKLKDIVGENTILMQEEQSTGKYSSTSQSKINSNYSSSSVPPKPGLTFHNNRTGTNSESTNKFYGSNNIHSNKNDNKILFKKTSERKIYDARPEQSRLIRGAEQQYKLKNQEKKTTENISTSLRKIPNTNIKLENIKKFINSQQDGNKNSSNLYDTKSKLQLPSSSTNNFPVQSSVIVYQSHGNMGQTNLGAMSAQMVSQGATLKKTTAPSRRQSGGGSSMPSTSQHQQLQRFSNQIQDNLMQTRKLGNIYTMKEDQSNNNTFGRQSGAVMVTDKRGKQVLMKKYGGAGGVGGVTSSNNTNNTTRINSTNSKGNKVISSMKMGDYQNSKGGGASSKPQTYLHQSQQLMGGQKQGPLYHQQQQQKGQRNTMINLTHTAGKILRATANAQGKSQPFYSYTKTQNSPKRSASKPSGGDRQYYQVKMKGQMGRGGGINAIKALKGNQSSALVHHPHHKIQEAGKKFKEDFPSPRQN